jgi:uncharacterized protein (TIGR02284 family)
MRYNEETIEVLNDLVRINNDRIEGYDQAIKETDMEHIDLITIFSRMKDESARYRTEIEKVIRQIGGEPDHESTTGSGKLYRFWMDIKAALSGNQKLTVMQSCEFGEDAAQKAYDKALESDATTDVDIRRMILDQKAALKISHDTIRNIRDTLRKQSA